MADLDLRPERREQLASSLCAALTTVIPGSQAGLRGSLGAGTADQYSDIDLCWLAPDDSFTTALDSADRAVRSMGTVSSLRVDPSLARSDRRRLIFLRLAATPLFWRVDLDIRAVSVASDDHYDAANPNARSEVEWSRPASAIENAIAAIKAAARRQPGTTNGLLSRGYQRVGLDPSPGAGLAERITRLADSCAAIEPGLMGTAAEVREVVDIFVRTGLLPRS